MQQDVAEVIAAKALAWLTGKDGHLAVFLGASGLAVNDVAAQAGEPEFLASVLDFVLMDDAWIVSACDSLGLDYASLSQARQALPGGEQVNWT